jgi:ubiquinone biosynthesis accessory factor UbiK
MIDLRALDDLSQRVSALLPDDLGAASADFQKNLKAALAVGLRKLDLVTREEFEVQRAVLLRSREKLEALERKLAQLEAQSASDATS